MTLRQLRYLEALAETLHFGHAAEACAVTQPALSMQIKELEDELQVSLIERRKSGIELTEQGEEIVGAGAPFSPRCATYSTTPSIARGVLTGALKLGAIPSIAPYLLPAALPELQRRFPDLTLHLRETITETLVRELVSGDLDVILVALPIEDPEIETLHLFDDKFVLAARATKGKRAKAADMLAHERLLFLEEGHCLRDQALSFCRLVTPEARESFGASSLATIVQMVAHGYGITLLPEMAVESEVHRRGDIRLCISRRQSPNARSGLPGARPLRARQTFMPGDASQGCDAPPRQVLMRGSGRGGGVAGLAVGDAEGGAEALGVLARGVPARAGGDQHVDAVAGRDDAHEMIDLALAVVGDGLEAVAAGDGLGGRACAPSTHSPWRAATILT